MNSITCFYQNIRGTNTKLVEFFNNTLSMDIDIIAITETWLTYAVLDSEIINESYNVFRSD